jgi:RNA polymerase sigma-70 factor (sigma-E family)
VGPEDEAAFRDFVVGRTGAMLRAAYLLTGDHGLAEDAVQSVFGRMYLAWPRIERREAVEAYCRRALVREVGSWRRRRQVGHVLTADPPDVVPAPATEPAMPNDVIRRALLELSPRERAAVVMRFYVDLSVGEVAGMLDVSEGTVKQLTHRGLAKLRQALGDEAAVVSEESGR